MAKLNVVLKDDGVWLEFQVGTQSVAVRAEDIEIPGAHPSVKETIVAWCAVMQTEVLMRPGQQEKPL